MTLAKSIPSFVVSSILFFAFLLGVKSLEELDIWIFLKTGEWIWKHGQIPYTDTFSYTFQGHPWIHIKWGYSFLSYVLQQIGDGPEFMMLFQALCNLLIAFLILRTAQVRFPKLNLNIWTFLIFILLWVSCEYRMNGRPENFSHVFLMFYAFAFQKHEQNKHWIWILIPVQIVWSNIHDAYTLGLLISFVFAVTQFIQTKYKHLLFWFLGLLCASCINPLGIDSLTYTWSVFTQLQTNQYTPELFSALYPEYWTHLAPYVMLLGLVLFLLQIKIMGSITKLINWYFIIGILLFFIGLSNYRNIVFFLFWISPFILSLLPQTKHFNLTLLLIIPLFYLSIVSGFYYQNIESRHRFGLYYSEQKHPVLASSYIKKNELTKGTCAEGNMLADYLSSSYLLWDLYPNFKSYIDLRDLDVFTPQFFEHYYSLLQNPAALEEIFQTYNITQVALYLKTEARVHKYLYQHPTWQLVYLDYNMAIYQQICYVKNNAGAFEKVLQHNPHKHCSSIAFMLNRIFNWNWSNKIENQLNTEYTRAKYLELVGDEDALLLYLLKHQTKNMFDLNYQILLYKTLSKYPAYQTNIEALKQHIQALQNVNL